MDIHSLLPSSITYAVYSYIGWNILRKYKNIPDHVWCKICDDFCKDSNFKRKFKTYWKDPIHKRVFTWKSRFLIFINNVITWCTLIPPIDFPEILWNDKSFVFF